ncbi:MAG: DegV family protein [Clostridiales bacterium]|nr:DegV family protein [Clostridiales bacterium]
MMSKPVAITADSPIDLTPELAKQFNITIIPLYVGLADKTYRDGVDITPEDIFKRYEEEKIIPRTSSISIADYTDFFRSFTDKGMTVVHFSLSSEISSTHQNALIAAEDLNDVYIFDSLNLSTGIALLAEKACKMRDNGFEAEKIFEAVRDLRGHICQSFVIDKLEFLRKGGRCSAMTALGANMLSIHPSIEVRAGKLELAKKYRGKIETIQLNYIREQLNKHKDINLDTVFVCHSGISDIQLNAICSLVAEHLEFKEIIVTKAGCTISTHCGPDCLGFAYLTN